MEHPDSTGQESKPAQERNLSGRFTVAGRSCKGKLSEKTLPSVKEQRNYEGYGEEHSREGVDRPPDCSLGHVGAQGWLSLQKGGRGTHHQSMPPEREKEEAKPRHCWRLSGPPWLSAFNPFHKGLPQQLKAADCFLACDLLWADHIGKPGCSATPVLRSCQEKWNLHLLSGVQSFGELKLTRDVLPRG